MYSQERWSKKIKGSEVMGINDAIKNLMEYLGCRRLLSLLFRQYCFSTPSHFFPVHFRKEDIKKVLHSFSYHKPSGQMYRNTF